MWVLCGSLGGAGCESTGRCKTGDVRAEHTVRADVPWTCEIGSPLPEPLECVVVEVVDGDAPFVLGLDCADPPGVDLTVTMDLVPNAEIDLLEGGLVEVQSCGSGVRISDERGLVFGALERVNYEYIEREFSLDFVVEPLEIDIADRGCRERPRNRRWDDELTIRDGEDEVVVYSGNSGILEGSERWLVVVEELWDGVMYGDVNWSETDVAELRVR